MSTRMDWDDGSWRPEMHEPHRDTAPLLEITDLAVGYRTRRGTEAGGTGTGARTGTETGGTRSHTRTRSRGSRRQRGEGSRPAARHRADN